MYGHEIVTEIDLEPLPTPQEITPEFLTNSKKEFEMMKERFHRTSEYVNLSRTKPGSEETRMRIGLGDFLEIVKMTHRVFGSRDIPTRQRGSSAAERGMFLHKVFFDWNSSLENDFEESKFSEDAAKLVCALSRNQRYERYTGRQVLCGVGSTYNIPHLSPLISNVQVSLRLDFLEILELANGGQKVVIKDLKTGNPDLTDEEKLQALFMALFAEKPVKDAVNVQRWNKNKFKHTFKHNSDPGDFKLYYLFFDARNEGNIDEVLISLKDAKNREMVLERLIFYVEVALAFKEQVNKVLSGFRQELTPCYVVQNELPIIYPNSQGGVNVDLSNVPPARKKQEKYQGPVNQIREPEYHEKCSLCDKKMTQVHYNVRDFGGDKVSFWVQPICEDGHYNKTYYMRNVPREMLKH